MSTIPEYPWPSRPLDGTELMAAFQDGHQIALPVQTVFDAAKSAVAEEVQSDADLVLQPLVKAATDARDAAEEAAANAVTAIPSAASVAVSYAARAGIRNARNKVLLDNLRPGYLDPAGNPQNANDWRRFAATVTPELGLTSNFRFPSNTGVVFRRGDGSVVEVVRGLGTPSTGDIVPSYQMPIPPGAVIIEGSAPIYRFQSDGSNDQVLSPHVVLLEGVVAMPGLFSDYLLYDPTRSADDNRWVGRRVGVIGDSFWSGRRWYQQLQADTGIELVNFSQGGRTMDHALRDANGNPLTAASVSNLDALIVAIATNNAAAGLPVGYPDGPPATFDATAHMPAGGATFFSQGRGAVRTLTGWNPSMMLFFGTPIYRPGVSLIPDYQAAVGGLAEMYEGVLVEPDKKCGVNEMTAGTKLVDGVHPTEPGFESWYRSTWRDAFFRNSPFN